MLKATWNGAVLAEAQDDEIELVEGNVYFPPDKVDKSFLRDSATHTVCGWKGTANYYDVIVDGAVNKDAAWYYPVTKPEAEHVAGYIAFWKGVSVEQ